MCPCGAAPVTSDRTPAPIDAAHSSMRRTSQRRVAWPDEVCRGAVVVVVVVTWCFTPSQPVRLYQGETSHGPAYTVFVGPRDKLYQLVGRFGQAIRL